MSTHPSRRFSFEHVDVFTDTPLKGNPLAVFPYGDVLSDGEMQAIAQELNLAETVFVCAPRSAQSRATLRIFTPRRELPFAGHPTVGALSVLLRHGRVPRGPFVIDEGVGPVSVRIDDDESSSPFVWLTTPRVEIHPQPDVAAAAASLGLGADDVHPMIAPAYASAGSPFLFVAVKDAGTVDRAAMRLAELPPAPWPDVVGTFVYSPVTTNLADFGVYARMFAPQSGIPEDPATGGATGPLVVLLIESGFLPAERSFSFLNRQGVQMGRESHVYARVTREANGTESIVIGGRAVPLISGELAL